MAEYDVVVVGAGFTGLYALHRLRAAGFRAHAVEAGADVGGTWFFNRYPGARCDISSVHYSYSFDEDLQREWTWSQRYATQPEILAYLRHVADRFDLRRDITFGTRVTAATYTDGDWLVSTDTGEELRARHLVSAVGCLSAKRIPDLPGLDEFTGPVLHTGNWPAEPVDVTGRRVGVIGTGSSGVQAIPALASQAAHVTVFQRTANFVVPVHHGPIAEAEWQEIKAGYPELRQRSRESYSGVAIETRQSLLALSEAERRTALDKLWQAGGIEFFFSFGDPIREWAANNVLADFLRGKIAELVPDPDTAAALSPRSHPVGAKRPCVGEAYFETFNRDNVSLVDLRAHPIERVLPGGVQAGGQDHDLDLLVLATGYDAMTGPLLRMDIRGVDGVSLAQRWAAGPSTYLGLAVSGFPNLHLLTGPGSPSVLANVPLAAEQHVEWVTELLIHLRDNGFRRIEADLAAEAEWTETVAAIAAQTLYPEADSWYLGANIPGKPRVFMPYAGGLGNYRAQCAQIAADGYRGFRLS